MYATLWCLMFPRYGDDHTGCEWIEVRAQGVPAHIGTPTPGYGYEGGDPYGAFLPSPIPVADEDDASKLRAVVIVTKDTAKVVQEYIDPLLVLASSEYEALPFAELHRRICDALRGDKPRLVAETWEPDGTVRLLFADGSSRITRPDVL